MWRASRGFGFQYVPRYSVDTFLRKSSKSRDGKVFASQNRCRGIRYSPDEHSSEPSLDDGKASFNFLSQISAFRSLSSRNSVESCGMV